MFFEVCRDVVEGAIRSAGDYNNFEFRALKDLAAAVSHGNHIVYVECLNDKEVRSVLSSLMGNVDVELLRMTNGQDAGALKSKLRWKVEVSVRESTRQDGTIIYLNPRTVDFDFSVQTFLVTENLSDTPFYKILSDYYKQQINLKLVNTKYEYYSGGGVCLSEVLEKDAKNGSHLCLAIADSDKHYPTCKYGDTSQKAMDLIKELKPFNCALYVLQVQEIENLIPEKILKIHSQYTAKFDAVFSAEWQFFDIKKGITCKALWNESYASYWRSQFPNIDFSSVDKARASSRCQQTFIEALKKEYPNGLYVNICWGDSVLKDSMADYHLYNIQSSDLTTIQQQEWFNIGEIFFNWTCCLKRHHR